MRPATKQRRRRARENGGFGMIELVCAMGVMAIGIMAVFALFHSGMVQLTRPSKVSTAAALADSEMEKYRALKFDAIGLVASDVTSADATYKGDAAYQADTAPATTVKVTLDPNVDTLQ